MLKAKAYNTRVFTIYLVEKSLERAELLPGNPWAESRATCMWALAEVFHIMDIGGRFFSLSECYKFVNAGKTFLLVYHDLHCRSI